MTRATRPLALLGATAAAVALAACGGTTVSDDVPAKASATRAHDAETQPA